MKQKKYSGISVSKRLKESRKAAGFSASQVGQKIGLSRQTIMEYESGKSSPTLSTIASLCDLYQISPNFLFTGFNEKSNNTPEPYKRKLYSLLGLLVDGDVSFNPINDSLKIINEDLRKDFSYCAAIYKNNIREYTKLEIIESILNYMKAR